MEHYKKVFITLVVDGMSEEQARLEIIKRVKEDFSYLSEDRLEDTIDDVLSYIEEVGTRNGWPEFS